MGEAGAQTGVGAPGLLSWWAESLWEPGWGFPTGLGS